MTKRLFQTVTVAAFCVSMVFGQGGGTPPTAAEMVARQVERLSDTLTLTSAQQTQATSIFTASHAATAPLQTSMQAARTALQAAVPKNDTATITAQSQQIGTLTAQLTAAQANAEAQFYQILTADQQTKYATALASGRGGMGGPGAFGGPRPARARQNQ